MTHMYRMIGGKRVEVARCETWRNGRQCPHLATRRYIKQSLAHGVERRHLCDKCAEELLARGVELGELAATSSKGWLVTHEYLQWTPIYREQTGRTLTAIV
jgi:hypothetical protein